MSKPEENPLTSIRNAIAQDALDWGLDRHHAWIYGIVFGWDEAQVDGESAFHEIQRKHGFSATEMARLQRLHLRFKMLADMADVLNDQT